MHEHLLRGCQPEPLGSYLKALGVLRLVAEQKDPAAAGWWTSDGFVLRTELDEPALLEFFAAEYRPSPVANPWNGAGGFYCREDKKTGRRTKPTAATKALASVRDAEADRLKALRAAIQVAERCVRKFGFEEAPKNEDKLALVLELRDRLPDEALGWLDAVLVVDVESLGFPPVLGTGGTEGNLDFASNFYQRLADVFAFDTGAPSAGTETVLRAALFGDAVSGMAKAAIGQFDPGGAGGGNAAPGFDGASLVNPWDFILILEGTLLLASATTRKMEQAGPGSLTYPFSVRAVGADYASSSDADEAGSRHELWMPLWSAPTRRAELSRLFGEGRADVHRRRAVHAVDFARAVASLGVDRGIAEFTRFGFHQRNGKSYFATPLGRWTVRRNPEVDLIDARLGRWLDALRRAGQDSHAPASWRRVIKRVERAILELARTGSSDAVAGVLVALADAEAELSGSPAGREKIRQPVPPLGADWLRKADDGSVEHELAWSLATTPVRERLTWARWGRSERSTSWAATDDQRTVWGRLSLLRGLAAVVQRAEIESTMESEDAVARGRTGAPRAPSARALRAFLDGDLDESKLAERARGYSLVAPTAARSVQPNRSWAPLPAPFAACALVHARVLPEADDPLPRTAGLVSALVAGRHGAGVELALRRLEAAGVTPALRAAPGTRAEARRIAAALAFPVDRSLARAALRSLVPPDESSNDSGSTATAAVDLDATTQEMI